MTRRFDHTIESMLVDQARNDRVYCKHGNRLDEQLCTYEHSETDQAFADGSIGWQGSLSVPEFETEPRTTTVEFGFRGLVFANYAGMFNVPDEIHVPTAEDVQWFGEVDAHPTMAKALFPYVDGRRYESKDEH